MALSIRSTASPGAQQRYAHLNRDLRLEPKATNFGVMFVYRRAAGAGLPIEAALTLTEAVRKALLSNAGKGGEIAGVINGHESGPHCAIAALPLWIVNTLTDISWDSR